MIALAKQPKSKPKRGLRRHNPGCCALCEGSLKGHTYVGPENHWLWYPWGREGRPYEGCSLCYDCWEDLWRVYFRCDRLWLKDFKVPASATNRRRMVCVLLEAGMLKADIIHFLNMGRTTLWGDLKIIRQTYATHITEQIVPK